MSVFLLGISVGDRLFAQSYSPMYAPVTGNTQSWTCVDPTNGNPVPGASWWIYEAGYYYGTNDHLHSATLPPTSTEQPSSGTADSNGNFSFYLNTSLISQAEFYVVTCAASGYNEGYAEADYAVGYQDIYWVSQPATLYQIGGNTTNHGDNTGDHWMMSSPAYGIWYTAMAYISMYNPGNLVCDNDMALPFGGKFDTQDNWTSPHVAHDRGSAVDIAVTSNQCPAQDVVTNGSAFLSLAVGTYHAQPYPISYAGSKDIHVNWLNPNTYPH